MEKDLKNIQRTAACPGTPRLREQTSRPPLSYVLVIRLADVGKYQDVIHAELLAN